MRRLIFMDGEFVKLDEKGTKFLSLALISDKGNKLYLEFEYNSNECLDWVKKNVVPYLIGCAASSEVNKNKIINFIEKEYGDIKPVLVADVNQFDWNAICNLFGTWNIPFFYIPIDFSTILFAKGYDIDINRFELAKELGISTNNFKQHNSLADVEVLYNMWIQLGF